MFSVKKQKAAFTGALAGFLNGLFGSGGGIIAVPLLKSDGLSQKEAQATSLLLMLTLSALSAAIYIYEGRVSFSDTAGFIPGGILGGIAAAFCFRKIKPRILRKIFGGVITFSALRIIWGIVSQWI